MSLSKSINKQWAANLVIFSTNLEGFRVHEFLFALPESGATGSIAMLATSELLAHQILLGVWRLLDRMHCMLNEHLRFVSIALMLAACCNADAPEDEYCVLVVSSSLTC